MGVVFLTKTLEVMLRLHLFCRRVHEENTRRVNTSNSKECVHDYPPTTRHNLESDLNKNLYIGNANQNQLT